MIQELTLRRWHRRAGIFLAVLILVQAISGVVIAFNLLFVFHHDVSALLDAREAHELHRAWDFIFMDIHYGGGAIGSIYHAAVGIGLVWIVWTGTVIFVRGAKRSREARLRAAQAKSEA
jgi:hypothetical protein